MCLTDIRWGSKYRNSCANRSCSWYTSFHKFYFILGTPYWELGAPKQYYVSKRCATKQECERESRDRMPYCTYVWYLDWKCSDCCSGDRCNYFVIVSLLFTLKLYWFYLKGYTRFLYIPLLFCFSWAVALQRQAQWFCQSVYWHYLLYEVGYWHNFSEPLHGYLLKFFFYKIYDSFYYDIIFWCLGVDHIYQKFHWSHFFPPHCSTMIINYQFWLARKYFDEVAEDLFSILFWESLVKKTSLDWAKLWP